MQRGLFDDSTIGPNYEEGGRRSPVDWSKVDVTNPNEVSQALDRSNDYVNTSYGSDYDLLYYHTDITF